LQTLPRIDQSGNRDEQVSNRAGFSLHAGVACKAGQREKLDRPGGVPLCRYTARPAIAEHRLSLANNGNMVVELKSPYNDGTTHVILSPMEFLGRLVALVPRPWANLTRFHGVLSRGGPPPNSKLRKQIVPEKPVQVEAGRSPAERSPAERSPAERSPVGSKPGSKRYGMYWAQRLKRVLTGRPSA
jgi:hypothetical protein